MRGWQGATYCRGQIGSLIVSLRHFGLFNDRLQGNLERDLPSSGDDFGSEIDFLHKFLVTGSRAFYNPSNTALEVVVSFIRLRYVTVCSAAGCISSE